MSSASCSPLGSSWHAHATSSLDATSALASCGCMDACTSTCMIAHILTREIGKVYLTHLAKQARTPPFITRTLQSRHALYPYGYSRHCFACRGLHFCMALCKAQSDSFLPKISNTMRKWICSNKSQGLLCSAGGGWDTQLTATGCKCVCLVHIHNSF